MCGEVVFWVSGNVYECVCENKICNFTLMCRRIEWRTGARDTHSCVTYRDSLCVYVREDFLIYSFSKKQFALFPSWHCRGNYIQRDSPSLDAFFFLFYHHLAVFCFPFYHLLYRCLLFTSLVTDLSFSISTSLISPSAFIWCALFPCPPLCPSQLLSLYFPTLRLHRLSSFHPLS